jgi:hypothetical protein
MQRALLERADILTEDEMDGLPAGFPRDGTKAGGWAKRSVTVDPPHTGRTDSSFPGKRP